MGETASFNKSNKLKNKQTNNKNWHRRTGCQPKRPLNWKKGVKFPKSLDWRISPPHHLRDSCWCGRGNTCKMDPSYKLYREPWHSSLKPQALGSLRRGSLTNQTAKFHWFALGYYRKLFVWLLKIKHILLRSLWHASSTLFQAIVS